MINSTQANPSFLKFANNVKVGPIIESTISPGETTGPALYIGTNPDPSIISDSQTLKALNNVQNKTLNDMSLYVQGPDGTSIYLSMDALYYTIDYIQSNGFNTSNTYITFWPVDAVSNGQIGQMIVFGSNFIPSSDTSSSDDGSGD